MVSKDFNPSLSHPYYFIRKGLYNKIRQYAPKFEGDLLDFGCGSKPYKSLFGHCTSYTGVDFESEGHSHINESIDYFYDGKTLPFSDDSFDNIFTSEVFEHIFNLPEILAELHRVLKPSGKILLTCPFVWPEHEKPYDYARYTIFALKSELEKQGFKIVIIDKCGDFFTAIYQLRVAYLYDVLLPKFSLRNRARFLYKLSCAILIPIANFFGKILSRILPTNKVFYLNNIVIAEKI